MPVLGLPRSLSITCLGVILFAGGGGGGVPPGPSLPGCQGSLSRFSATGVPTHIRVIYSRHFYGPKAQVFARDGSLPAGLFLLHVDFLFGAFWRRRGFVVIRQFRPPPPLVSHGGGGGGGVVSFNKASLCAKHLGFVFLYYGSYSCVEGNCFVLKPFKTLNFPIVIDSLLAHAG